MATIPLGNFGNVMPHAPVGRVLDVEAGQIGNALSSVGQTGQKIAVKDLHEQQKIQDEKDEYFFNTQAAKYGAEYTDAVTDTKQKLVTGEFDETTAKANLRRRSDELNESYRQTLPKTKHEKFDYYTERMFYESEANVKPIAYDTERRKINADFDQVTEATLKMDNREQSYALFQDTVERNPFLTPEQKVKTNKDWNKRRDLTEAKGVLSALDGASDIEGLTKLKNSADKLFPHLTIETRDAYSGQIDHAITRINKTIEIAKKAEDVELKAEVNTFRTDAYTGYPITAERVDETLAKVKGTKYEAQVREDIAFNKEAQTFRDLSPLEQERQVVRLGAELERTPQDDSSLLVKRLNVYKGIQSASKNRASNDPVSLIPSAKPVTIEQLLSGQVDAKQSAVTTQLLADQKKKNGGIGSLVQFNASERKALPEDFFSRSISKQKEILFNLTTLSGENKEANLEYFSLLQGKEHAYEYMGIAQIGKKGIRIAGTSTQVADVILEGKAIVNRKQDSDVARKQAVLQEVNKSYGNAVGVGTLEQSTYNNMIYDLYVGLAKREGSIKLDDKGSPLVNTDLARRAFNMVTGGTFKQNFGKNSNSVFMPYGHNETIFRDTIDEYFRVQYRKETGYLPPSGVLKDYAVIQNPTGSYSFMTPEGKYLTNPKTAKQLKINIPVR